MADVTRDEPRFGEDAVRVDLARGSIKALVIFLPLVGGACAASVYAAIDATDTAVTVVGVCFATFFGLLLAMVLLGMSRLVEPRGLVFDARGVHVWRRRAWDLLPWNDVAAIGMAYVEPARPPMVKLSHYLADKTLDAMKVERRRNITVDVFPESPADLEHHPVLARYVRNEEPPRAGLSRLRWRVPLPPFGSLPQAAATAVQTHQPGKWLGWFERRRGS